MKRNLHMNTVGIVALLLVIAFLLWKMFGTHGGSAPDAIRVAIQQGAKVVDVRTPAEYASDHYPDAVNIPLDSLSSRTGELGDPSRPVVVYCASGMRSSRAKAVLEKAGFASVLNGGGLSSMPAR
jgi:phage shock protein E